MKFIDKFEIYDIPLHGVRLPNFEIPLDYKKKLGISDSSSNFDFLEKLVNEGFSKLKMGEGKIEEYKNRIKTELATLKELEFIDYILLVWMIINFCKDNNIPTGAGRGSAAGSLVLFLIGVTRIDPMEYDLYFERFISKTRAKKQVVDGITYLDGSLMCDIDLDICYYNRHKVLEFLEKIFLGKTSKIITYNSLQGKLLIKECGKIIGEKSETEVNLISEMIPKIYGVVKNIEEVYDNKDGDDSQEFKDFKQWCDENKEVYEIALKLRGLIKNKSVHPSGILISYHDIQESLPTELSSTKEPVCCFDMQWATLINLKLDILGLRNVSVVDDVCKNVGIKPSDINVHDDIIYTNLYDLKSPHGIFQLEAPTIYKACQKVKPKNLEELSALMALARPGALQFIDRYARYSNTGTEEGIHPFFDKLLKDTGGLVLYQEQLMKIANKIGFTLEEAETIRRIVGKKKIEEVKKWKEKVDDKVKLNNLDENIGKLFWRILEDSASYSFNKSHSFCYSVLAAETLYLKFKFPLQFFLSLLKMTKHEPEPIPQITIIQKELQHFGIKLLPPHIIKSEMDFSIEDGNIRFGLLSIKGISDKSIEKINKFKNKQSNKFNIFEAAKESELHINVLCSLIMAGALEGFKQSRSRIVLEAQLWNILTKTEKEYMLRFGEEFDYDLINIINHMKKLTNDKDKPILKETRLQTIRNKFAPYKQIYDQNKKCERFSNWYYENVLLGYTYNTSLRDIFKEKNHNLKSILEIKEMPVESNISLIGVVKEFTLGTSKLKKTKYLRLLITDETSEMTVLLFGKSPESKDDREDKLENCKLLNDGLPKEGNIVIIFGRKKEDAIFADRISVQDQIVYTKLSQLKEKESSTEEKKENKKVNKIIDY